MEAQLSELKRRLVEIDDLQRAAAVLEWDQSTYMPEGGAAARGRQLATLGRLAHERSVSPELGATLKALAPHEDRLAEPDAALVRLALRNFERARRVPPDYVAELRAHLTASYVAWTKARPANDFATMRPYLEKTLELSRRYGSFFPEHAHPIDALIDEMDPGTTVADVQLLFEQLRGVLVPIVKKIASQPSPSDACLHGAFPEASQLAFGEEVVRALGYDWNRGRQDRTHHPFMTKFSVGDVRITTRISEDDVCDALFSTIHETGHALYEQNVSAAFEGLPLANGASAGVHESQSRLWENLVARSKPFWNFFFPKLVDRFPEQLRGVSVDDFYRAINLVRPSLVRVDADEVTYNLHVMIRCALEREMFDGKLAVKDLPEAWHARYQSDLGVRAPSDVDGCMQDVHWYVDKIGGAFQGYTLGNVMSAQFWQAAVAAHPSIPSDIERGDTSKLRGFLAKEVYSHGASYLPSEVVRRATGKPLSIEPYARYLREKFGSLYAL